MHSFECCLHVSELSHATIKGCAKGTDMNDVFLCPRPERSAGGN